VTDSGATGAVRELDRQECWRYLQAHDFGRIAVAPRGDVAIYPINYVVQNGRIRLRTSPGAKLFALLLNARVAFEIDGQEKDSAWSVLVRGTAEEAEMPPDLELPETNERPWVPGPREVLVEITAEEITGRAFDRAASGERPPAG
jgi:hypothetical protein